MKTEGVHHAVGFGGLELPVIDVTHPAFAPPDPAAMDASTRDFLAQDRNQQRIPGFLRRPLMGLVLRRSLIGKGLLAAQGTFLKALPTYLLKLGADNLGDFATPVDLRIAASLPSLAMRLRLDHVAHLLAEGLVPLLEARRDRPLRFLNIAGGATSDSLNALLVLHRDRPDLLRGRFIRITVLDAEDEAPAFGAASLAALQAPGGPLKGLDVHHEHLPYDWRDPSLLGRIAPGDEVVAGSSEGGLFDYGSDEEIVENLRAFRAAMPVDAFLVGTVSRADGVALQVNRESHAAIRPRTLEAFTELAARGGYAIDKELDNPLTRDVRLRRV